MNSKPVFQKVLQFSKGCILAATLISPVFADHLKAISSSKFATPAPTLTSFSSEQVEMINSVLDQFVQSKNPYKAAQVKLRLEQGALKSSTEVASLRFALDFELDSTNEFAPAVAKVMLGLNFEDSVHAVIFGDGKAPVLGDHMQELLLLGEERIKEASAQHPEYYFNFKHDAYIENDQPWVYADFSVFREKEANAQASFHYNLNTQNFFFHSIVELDPLTSPLGMNLKESINDLILAILEQRSMPVMGSVNLLKAQLESLASVAIQFNFEGISLF